MSNEITGLSSKRVFNVKAKQNNLFALRKMFYPAPNRQAQTYIFKA